MKVISQKDYIDLRHKMYDTHTTYDCDGNKWCIYKQPINEYNGIHNKQYGAQFIIESVYTKHKFTRSTKQNVIKFLNKYK